MNRSRCARGLAVCVALAVFVAGAAAFARIDDVASTADEAHAVAEEATSKADEVSGRVDDLEGRVDSACEGRYC